MELHVAVLTEDLKLAVAVCGAVDVGGATLVHALVSLLLHLSRKDKHGNNIDYIIIKHVHTQT